MGSDEKGDGRYYPFGLTMAGISDKALKGQYAENKIRFQKQELQNKEFTDGSGLEIYEFKYRMDDAQTGRFWQIDPLANKYIYNSPYAFSENKVTGHVELEGLEAIQTNNPYIRAAMHKDVQKNAKKLNDNVSGSVEVKVSVGPGVGVSGNIGKTGLKAEANGPQVSVTVNGAGKTKVEGSAASASVGGGVGKVLSAETAVKVGAVEVKDGSLDINLVTVENNVAVGVQKKIGDDEASEKVSADPASVGFGAKLGAVGASVKVNLNKAAHSVSSWFSTVGSYFSSLFEEKNDQFFGSHGKPESENQ